MARRKRVRISIQAIQLYLGSANFYHLKRLIEELGIRYRPKKGLTLEQAKAVLAAHYQGIGDVELRHRWEKPKPGLFSPSGVPAERQGSQRFAPDE